MKIQIITNLYPLPWEPNRAAFNRQQFDHLAKRCSVRITVLIGWIASLGKSLRNAPEPTESRLQNTDIPISYLRYFYVPAIGRFTHAITLALALATVRAAIKKQEPDCLLLSWAFPDGVAGMWLAQSLGIPAVIKVHGSDVNLHAQHRLRAMQIRWAMNKAAAVISVSQALADRLVEIGVQKEKIKTIYNGVNHSVFYPQDMEACREELGIKPDKTLVLFIGNLKQEKGCVDLVKAFVAIAGQAPDLDLYYIGSGKEKQAILEHAKNESLEGRVTLLGSMGHSDLRKWINASTLVALPSYNEGVPNVLLEAMTCGKPVLASRVGGIPEVVQKEAGILVEARDIEGLGAGMLAAISKDWDSSAICKSVAQFSWDKNIDEVCELLESAVGASNS